ncbi:MAG: hypothetical protein U5R31_11880 [Acidimicrobiia bacterium]|nr:hypothetical protein [Acidimicrobiia bacterium]
MKHLRLVGVEVDGDRVAAQDPGVPVAVGPIEVAPPDATSGGTWSVANRGDVLVPVRSARAVFALEPDGPVRVFRHGYQSWSRTGVATLGADPDPSRAPDSLELVRAVHHADQVVATEGELRSELVTVLADDGDQRWAFGALGGARHDTTFRLREVDGVVELAVEAFLGGAVLDPGSVRSLHELWVGSGGDHAVLLEQWADLAGRAGSARTDAPFQVGWCSWYHYFHAVDETAFQSNLELADDWPFTVFQLDDGFQAAIGDWFEVGEGFESDLDDLASDVGDRGSRAGDLVGAVPGSARESDRSRTPEWFTANMPPDVRSWACGTPSGVVRSGPSTRRTPRCRSTWPGWRPSALARGSPT